MKFSGGLSEFSRVFMLLAKFAMIIRCTWKLSVLQYELSLELCENKVSFSRVIQGNQQCAGWMICVQWLTVGQWYKTLTFFWVGWRRRWTGISSSSTYVSDSLSSSDSGANAVASLTSDVGIASDTAIGQHTAYTRDWLAVDSSCWRPLLPYR